jgi:phage-related holin
LKTPVDITAILDAVVHSISTLLVFLLGTLNPQIGYFFLGLLLDIALGVWIAIKTKNFSKKYLITKTLEKLVVYTILIAIGHVVDVVGNFKDQIRGAILLGLLIKEAPSLLSKLKALGYSKEAAVLEDSLLKNNSERSEKDENGQ